MSDDTAARPPSDWPTASRAEPNDASLAPAVVGIGASAGGLAAFTDFLEHMPPDSGLAFVLVQHLDPRQPSLLPELLASHTPMPVGPVVDQTPVAPNHVYLIPPNTALTIAQGVLRLEPPTAAHGQRLPIDHFFRSLAADQGQRATGIVLSGTGADGSKGLAAIRARGGLTLAQIPASAAHPSMPEQAIARGVVDHSLDVAAMPALLLARAGLAPAPLATPVPAAASGARQPRADTFSAITSILKQTAGHDFSRYKRTTLQRRIDRRMQLLHLGSLGEYCARLQQDRGEVEQLFQDLLISVTEFFRDPAAFEALAALALPSLLRGRDARRPLRVWVPGCASGEEVYSIAILLQEQLAQLAAPPLLQLFATDIDEAALAIARRGRYDASIAAHVTPERLARYFVPDGRGYQIIKAIREPCLFSAHNLISDPPFGRMDLIVCRNLLIYFAADLQRQLIPVFHYALAPGGYLFLGSAESAISGAGAPELFRVVDGQQRIYQRKERLVRPQVKLPWVTTGRQLPRRVGATQRASQVADRPAESAAPAEALAQELQRTRSTLEATIAARTQDLALANTALQAQIAERVQSEQTRQQLLRQLVTAQEEERRHIARELHDQLGQELTALILGLKALQGNLNAGDGPAERIAQLQAMAVHIGQEVRSLAVQLRPSVLDDLGLNLALSNYVEQWSARANVAVDLHTSHLDGERLPLAVETTLYRLVQEALTNVLKHAQASEVSVIIERRSDEVRLIVEDDGVGFSVPAAPSDLDATPQLGLLGMQERVALLNGTLTVEAAPGSGTSIFAHIPLPAAAKGGSDDNHQRGSGR